MGDVPASDTEAPLPQQPTHQSLTTEQRLIRAQQAARYLANLTDLDPVGPLPLGRPSLSLTSAQTSLMAPVGALAELPRALTPLSQGDFYPGQEANSPADSVLAFYIDSPSTASPVASMSGMMRNSVETGPIGEHSFESRGPMLTSHSLPADQLPDHQRRQMENFGQPWRRHGALAQGHFRPPSSASHREQSFTSDRGSSYGGGYPGSHPRRPHRSHTPLSATRFPYGRPHALQGNRYRHTPHQNMRIQSMTDLRPGPGSVEGHQPRRIAGRDPSLRSYSPAFSEGMHSGSRPYHSSGQSSGSLVSVPRRHMNGRTSSMTTLRNVQRPPPAGMIMPASHRSGSPMPVQFQRLEARPSSSMSNTPRTRGRRAATPRVNGGRSRPIDIPVPAQRQPVEYYDYGEEFAVADLIDSYREDDDQATPRPFTAEVDGASPAKNSFPGENDAYPQVESPSPIAATTKITPKRLSIWSKKTVVDKDPDFDTIDAEMDPPVFGATERFAQALQGRHDLSAEAAQHDIGIDGTVENGHALRKSTQGHTPTMTHSTENTGYNHMTAEDISTASNNANQESNVAKFTMKVWGPENLEAPSEHRSNAGLSPHETVAEQSSRNPPDSLRSPVYDIVSDGPSLTDGFLDMVDSNRNGGRRTNLRYDVPRPESSTTAWNTVPSRADRQASPNPDLVYDASFHKNIPPRTSSARRPGGLSDVDEESTGTGQPRPSHDVANADSSSGPESRADESDRRLRRQSASLGLGESYREEARRREEAERREGGRRGHRLYAELVTAQDAGDGAGSAHLPGNWVGPPRLEITRATGSTDRSLTQSDDQSTISRLNPHLQAYVDSRKTDNVSQSRSVDKGSSGRAKITTAEGVFGGKPGVASSGQRSSHGRHSDMTPFSLGRDVSSLQMLSSRHSDRAINRSPFVISGASRPRASTGHGAGDMTTSDEISFAASIDSTAATKPGASAKASHKPKGHLRARVKEWLARKGLWKPGKPKGARKPGHTQSDKGV